MKINIENTTLEFDPLSGDRLRSFIRRALRSDGSNMAVPVIEVTKPNGFERLYMHPERGPILSTEDLYF